MAVSWGPILLAAVSLGLLVVIVASLRFVSNRRDRPQNTYQPGKAQDAAGVPALSGSANRRMLEADVPEAELESVDHDEYDPVGTALLLTAYFVVVGAVWLFMYFVEFLGNGPTVIG
ncbi:halocyanin [Halobellus sp. EA9]|uniref:halocyanin n=1 Tax=Halobellus sp. EA9 TaxID=3421647 RepID=UPI003EB7CDAE